MKLILIVQLVVVCTGPTVGCHAGMSESMTRAVVHSSVSGVTRLSEYSCCVAGPVAHQAGGLRGERGIKGKQLR